MAITYYQANQILDRAFGAQTWTPPSTLYIGLSTTTINSDGTGATEPSAGYAYSRVAVTNDKSGSGWTYATSSTLKNAAQLTFPESSGSWGTVTYIFITDAATSGNILYYDALTPNRTVAPNTTLYFGVNNITISMANS